MAIVLIEVLVVAIRQGGLFVTVGVCHVSLRLSEKWKSKWVQENDETVGEVKILKAQNTLENGKDTYAKAK